jgi:broad specificity phosphatase PhoE
MLPNQAKVLIVRHGSTDLNKESGDSPDRIRGWIDVPLNDKGRKDAENAAKKLAHEDPVAIHTSDLIRAEETAHIINKDFHVPLDISTDLRPWNLGVYQGQETAKIIDELTDLIRNENKRPVDGETFKEFRIRYLKKLNQIMEQAEVSNACLFVVSHFRNLKTAQAWLCNGAPEDLSIDVEEMMADNFKPGDVFNVPLDHKKGEELEKE